MYNYEMKSFISLLLTTVLLMKIPAITFASTKTPSIISSGPVNPFSFSAAPGANPGSVQVTWYDDGKLTRTYNLYYGLTPGNYLYAVPNIAHNAGEVNEFTVGALISNTIYYFRLDAISGGTYLTSGPIKAVASSMQSVNNNSVLQTEVGDNTFYFNVTRGTKSGTVNVNWYDNGTANKYDIVYGPRVNENLYGVNGMYYKKKVNNEFTVGALTLGKKYYFSLVAERDNKVIFWSTPQGIIVK